MAALRAAARKELSLLSLKIQNEKMAPSIRRSADVRAHWMIHTADNSRMHTEGSKLFWSHFQATEEGTDLKSFQL